MGKLLLSPKELTGDLLGEFDAFVGESKGFGFADGVGDETFLVEAFSDVPVERFPSALVAAFFGPRVEEEEGERGLVDFFLIVIHWREFRGFSKRSEGRVAG